MSPLVSCFIWLVVCDEWLAICLSVFVSLTISLSLSLSHLSLLFAPFLPHDQLSVYSVLYTAVPGPSGIANSFKQCRQCDRMRTQGP